MSKDPAFLFYSQDWIVGCQTLTMEERGKYITIICQMHQQGRMTKETICFLVGSISDNLMSKFRLDESGKYYSERLEKEAEKRAKYTQSRRENGSHGGRPSDKKQKKISISKPTTNHMVIHMEDENEDVNENILDRYKADFEIFRKEYCGTKRGLDTEFEILRKHKDWKLIIPKLLPALRKQKQVKDSLKQSGKFTPEWKNLQTWLNQSCWEEESSKELQPKTIDTWSGVRQA